MSEVITQQEELELVNIIEIAQTKLTSNFTILLRRLNRHDTALTLQANNLNDYHIENVQTYRRLEEIIESKNKAVIQRLDELTGRMNSMEEKHSGLRDEVGEKGVGVKRLSDELFNTQLQFQQKLKVKERQLETATRHIQLLAMQQNRLNEEISKKENKVEAERIVKETQILKDKNSHFESELKVAAHKIQKMEILNEKAERIQAKKEVEIFKEIEERVKKQIKINLNGPIGLTSSKTTITNPSGVNSNNSNNLNKSLQSSAQKRQYEEKENNTPATNTPVRRTSLMMEDSFPNPDFMRNNIDLILQKWGDKIKYFEVQLKEINQNLKILNKHSSGKRTQSKDSGSQGIKQKINQIKPDIIKLWAKLDTIQDRLSYNQRKLEEKLKGISELTGLIKDNNSSKLQEKLKNLQTQIFTNLKEVRAKLQGKVAQPDYEKYCQHMDDRIVQINELIYLKSDKLEVKKALLFLESKIKEIILVISEDQQNEKDALLTKKQLKCISCDKELDKFSGMVSSPKGNWDGLPFKDHPPEILGRFGMTNFGSLAKKIKKLQSKDLPVLNKRNVNQSFQNSS